MSDPFGKPGAATSGGGRPRLHQIARGLAKDVTRKYAEGTDQEQTIKTRGRLVLMTPKRVERNVPGRNGTRDRWSVDVVILDGPEITEVIDAQTGDVMAELEEALVPGEENSLIKDMYVSSVTLGNQFEGAGIGTMILGRLGRLPKRGDQSPAYALLSYTEEEAQKARDYLAKFHNPFAEGAEDEEG